MPHFRERALAASLKRQSIGACIADCAHFRERALAASLKRRQIAAVDVARVISASARSRPH